MSESSETKEFRRRQQQGLGAPIDSWEANESRHVRVNDIVYKSNTWRTFEDFLFDYVKLLLTADWAKPEFSKPVIERHPLMRWYDKLCEFQKNQAKMASGEIYSSPTTGAVKAFLNIAYNLYLCAHNKSLHDSLLIRLRNEDQFEGALYEAYVIASFIKAGFEIELEDESDSTVSHCEFAAKHRISGRQFSVEAKATTLSSERSGHGEKPPRVRDRLFKALKKKSAHERIIFIELNRAEDTKKENPPKWLGVVADELSQAEKDFRIDGDPSAYVFVTNQNFMHWLDSPSKPELQVAAGYKIPDFPPYKLGECKMSELVAAREKHAEVLHLLEALNLYARVPSTFDDRAPEEVFDNVERFQIGQKLLIPDEHGLAVEAELISGLVIENGTKAWCQFNTAKGFCMVTFPLTEAETAIYNRSPETFFGALQEVRKPVTEPHECYDFIFGTFKNASKESLLKLIEGWPDFEALQKLDQAQLAKTYSERVSTDMWLDGQKRRQTIRQAT
jgi:hypothetical protein